MAMTTTTTNGKVARRGVSTLESLERRSLFSAAVDALPDLAAYQPPGWSGSIVVSNMPDTHFDSAALTATDNLFIDVAVQNSGSAPAGAFNVEVRVDGNLISTVTSPGLGTVEPTGAFFSASDIPQAPLASGEHTISVTIDPAGAVAESDETNNNFTKTFTVGQTVNAPPTIGFLTVDPEPVSFNQPITLTANDVNDPEGGVLNVQFFRETNGTLGLQTGEGGDTLVATDLLGPYTTVIQTTGLPAGAYTYYARATDIQGLTGEAVSAISTVRPGVVSAVPGAPDLLAESDTGVSASDNITKLNNDDPDTALKFSVANTVPGAIVELFSGGELIGSARATDTTTVITTTGEEKLGHGSVQILAFQTEPGKLRSGAATTTLTIDTTAPQVVGLEVSGRPWSNRFIDFLESSNLGDGHGFSVPLQTDAVTILPWVNLDQITFTLNEPVDVGSGALSVTGLANPQYDLLPPVKADGASVTYTLARTLPAERARLTFSTSDLAGNAIAEGEGGAFNQVLDVLPGDVNQSGGAVSASDLVLTRNRIGRSVNNPGTGATAYSVFNDLNGDTLINASDLVLVRNRVGTSQPSAASALLSKDDSPLA